MLYDWKRWVERFLARRSARSTAGAAQKRAEGPAEATAEPNAPAGEAEEVLVQPEPLAHHEQRRGQDRR